MKKTGMIVLVLWFVALVSNAQNLPVDAETKKITFQETITLDSVSREEIYNRSKEWIKLYYKTDKLSPDDVANFKVGKEGSFEMQLTYNYKFKYQYVVTYTILIAQKEGKYRFTISDFKTYEKQLGTKSAVALEIALVKMTTQNKTEANTQINKEINVVIDDMKKFMITGKHGTKEDW